MDDAGQKTPYLRTQIVVITVITKEAILRKGRCNHRPAVVVNKRVLAHLSYSHHGLAEQLFRLLENNNKLDHQYSWKIHVLPNTILSVLQLQAFLARPLSHIDH